VTVTAGKREKYPRLLVTTSQAHQDRAGRATRRARPRSVWGAEGGMAAGTRAAPREARGAQCKCNIELNSNCFYSHALCVGE
jgi:hypothetical protein